MSDQLNPEEIFDLRKYLKLNSEANADAVVVDTVKRRKMAGRLVSKTLFRKTKKCDGEKQFRKPLSQMKSVHI